MPLAGGPTQNLGVQLTLFQPGGRGANFACDITTCPPGFENLTASLLYDTSEVFIQIFQEFESVTSAFVK